MLLQTSIRILCHPYILRAIDIALKYVGKHLTFLWSRLGDLNPGPSVYDTDALPLS